MRMMGALRRKPPFQVLIVRELSRLGRESSETGMTIKKLAQAGVEIFESVTGKSLTPRNWLEKAMSAVQSAADEAHREASSIQVHAAHARLHKAGASLEDACMDIAIKTCSTARTATGDPPVACRTCS